MSSTAALNPRETPLVAGDTAPLFVLPAVDTAGRQFDVVLGDWLARGVVMLVFYQDDGMPVCTRELQAFAQEYGLLAEAGVQLLGMNTNGIGSHVKFQERDRFPFPLVSDFFGEAVRAYGMWDAEERKSRRGVVVVGQDGRVVYALPHFNPGAVAAFAGVFEALGLA